MAANLRDVIEEAVKSALAPLDGNVTEVLPGHDHADEEALFITVTLPPGTPALPGTKILSAATAISDALLSVGEHRFPYLRLDHEGEEAPEGTVRTAEH